MSRIKWPKYWTFSFSISPSNEYSRLISFRINWFDLLAVQGTLKSLFQQHGSKTSILWHSAFFMAQLSHPYITTGKTIWTSVGKLMSLLLIYCLYHGGFSGGSDGKESSCNTGDLGSISGSGRSPGEGNATHSSILAWRILWLEEPGGLQFMGLQRVEHD